jgi:hypothetical protein
MPEAPAETEGATAPAHADASGSTATLSQRLTQLEETVETLRREVEALKGSPR